MKRLISILLSLLLCFNITVVSIATSTESNVVRTDEVKTEAVNEESSKITNEIMLMNFIGVRLEEITRTESTILLKDTIDLIQRGGINYDTIDGVTETYLKSLFERTTDWKLEDMDRSRLLYNYSQKESRAMSEALKPGPMALLTTAVASAVTKDPLTAALSVGSLVADGVSSYYGSLEESEQQYDDGNFKLDKERLKTIDKIKGDFFVYCNTIKAKNNIPNEMIIYPEKARKYSENLLDTNLTRKLYYFKESDDKGLFDGLPSIHLELAKCYFEKGDYKKCVSEIDKYVESGVNIFNNDENLINTLPLGFAAASKYMSSSDYETYVVKNMKYAEELENLLVSGDIKNTLPMFRYKNILVYMDLYGKTNKKEYLDKAYSKCKSNIIPLVREQRKLEEQDKMAINELLINNLEALKALAEKRGIDNNEKKELNELILGDNYVIFGNLQLSEHYYFGDYLKDKFNYTTSTTTPYLFMRFDYFNLTFDYPLFTKDSIVSMQFKDASEKLVKKDLVFERIVDGTCCKFSLSNNDDEPFELNDITNVKVVIDAKPGVDCRKVSYDVECIKMPFGKEEVGNYTVDEMINELVDLGFDKDNIAAKKDKGFLEKDDGVVKFAVYTGWTYYPEYDKKNGWSSDYVYTWGKGDILSKNQQFYIEYR